MRLARIFIYTDNRQKHRDHMIHMITALQHLQTLMQLTSTGIWTGLAGWNSQAWTRQRWPLVVRKIVVRVKAATGFTRPSRARRRHSHRKQWPRLASSLITPTTKKNIIRTATYLFRIRSILSVLTLVTQHKKKYQLVIDVIRLQTWGQMLVPAWVWNNVPGN